MSVVIETTLGDITVDLYLNERPRACLNFLKLCKIKYYNFNLFHTISRGFIAQTGDPTGTRTGGESIFGVIDGATKRYFEAENEPRIKHTRPGLMSFVGGDDNMIGSQFFLTLGEDLTYLDEKHCVFGEVVEGVDILEAINEVICDNGDRPYQDVRITHTVVLNDPLPDPKHLKVPSRSPSPSAARLAGGRIAPDEEVDETSGRTNHEIAEMQAEREAKARATILEMVGDIPDAEMAPPENVLFVCKLNPVTTDDDLEIIFSRFGKIKSCEVIRDRKTGDSLQYAFIEFEEQKSCEDAYFKMGNVLIDDRRIHVDFSQSVSKVKWLGKGRGVTHYDERGNKRGMDSNNDIGKGNYKAKNGVSDEYRNKNKVGRRQSKSPRRRSSSPGKNRNNGSLKRDRSPKRSSFARRTPNTSRSSERHSQNRRSVERKRSISPSPVKSRRSRSPFYNRRRNRSPRQSPQRNRPSPKRHSNSFRNYTNYRSNSRNRRRSRSPLRNTTSKRERSESYNDRNSRKREVLNVSASKRSHTESRERRENLENRPERSRSPRLKSVSPRNKSSSVERNSAIGKKDKSVSPKRSIKETSEKSEILASESKVIKGITKKDKKKQKSNTSKSKKKKYQTDSSSETSETESEDDKPKKKKSKKKAKSSSESSSSEEDSSSSSEEEKPKIKSKKQKNLKVKKSKKSKKYKKKYSSSSDSSSSESASSSSEDTSSSSSSESDESSRSSKRKSKKKRTKSSSESD